MASMHVKKGDKVVIIAGADKNLEKAHEVLKVFAEAGKVLVKDVNMRWKHTQRSQQDPQGGRIRKEFPIDMSNVQLFSEKAGKGVRTHVKVVDGKRVRVGSCGTQFD